MSETVYALRMGKKADRKSPFVNLYGRKPNTVKSNIIDKIKGVSEVDQGLKFSTSDFEEEVDSAIMANGEREDARVQIGKSIQKKSGKTVKETAHTITFLPKDGKKEIVYSKRDVAKAKPQKKRTTPNLKDEQAGPSTRWNETEESSEDETYVASEETKDESTPTDTTITETVEDTAKCEEERESRPEANGTESEEIAISQETATPQELLTHQETANPAVNNIPGKGKKKAVKASVSCPPTKGKSPETAKRTLRNRCSSENRRIRQKQESKRT